jgi:hypothetical protein
LSNQIVRKYNLNGNTIFVEKVNQTQYISRVINGTLTDKYDHIKLKYVTAAKDLLTVKQFFELIITDRFEQKNKDYIIKIYRDFNQVRHCKDMSEVLKYAKWASHFIPNTFYKWNDRSVENLRYVQWMVFDFELRKSNGKCFLPAEVYEIFNQTVGFAPSIIKDSKTKGNYHVFLKHTSINGSTESTYLFRRIQAKIVEIIGCDTGAVGANHPFSIPKKEQKIYYFGDNVIDFNDLKNWWYKLITEDNKKIKYTANSTGKVSSLTEHMVWNHPAIEALLNHEYDGGSRNQAGFTLALLFYAMNKDRKEATTFLKEEWFPKAPQSGRSPYRLSELKASLKSAYENSYAGPSKEYIEALTGIEFNIKIYKSQSIREKIHNKNDNQEAIINYFRERNCEVEMIKKELIQDICNTQVSTLGKSFSYKSIERNLDKLKKEEVLTWTAKPGRHSKPITFRLINGVQKEETIIEEDYNVYVLGEIIS